MLKLMGGLRNVHNFTLKNSSGSFGDHLCYFCLVFVMLSCTSVYLCIVVTCWERVDLLALVCDV